MNFRTLAAVIEELCLLLPGARVSRVYEDADMNIILMLRKQGSNFVLLFAPDRSEPRLHLVSRKPHASRSLLTFTLFLKSRIAGGRVEHVSLLNQDRIAVLEFSRQEAGYRLIFELAGRAANLVFTDLSGRILAVYHPSASPGFSTRALLPGMPYEPPVRKATLDADQKAILNPVGTDLEPGRVNSDVEQYYERHLKLRRFAQSRARLAATLKKAVKKAGSRYEAVKGDLNKAENADAYRRAGDLILANLSTLRTGMSRAGLTGYDGGKSQVVLDPLRSPVRNAELYFKKYKKARAGLTIITRRLQETETELQALQQLLDETQNASDEQELSAVQSRLQDRAPGTGSTLPKNKKAQEPAGPAIRKVFFEGWEILIGKSAAGNDYLTTRLAGYNDLWLHAESLPGSHVLVRNPGNREFPEAVLVKAASLAAFYSKGKAAAKVRVAYTRASHVKKPKGAKPGLVVLLERKTIVAVPEQD